MGARLNGIQEVRGSNPLVSIAKALKTLCFQGFLLSQNKSTLAISETGIGMSTCAIIWIMRIMLVKSKDKMLFLCLISLVY